MKNFINIFLLFILIGVSSCQKETKERLKKVPGSFNYSGIYVRFLDTTGNDYLIDHHLKPNDVKVNYFNLNIGRDVTIQPACIFIENGNYYVFRLMIATNKSFTIGIGRHVMDTVDLFLSRLGYKEQYGKPYVDPLFGDTISAEESIDFTILKSAYYNHRRLAPPQFDADGNVHVHRIVVREDF